ncbi:MAG: AraC family transcriptional regulator [Mycobacterium sp.]
MEKPLARFAALSGYVEVAHASGLDPVRLLRDWGLDPMGVAQPDRWVAASAVVGILEASAAASGRDDFGLMLAERRRLSSLGPLSLALREQPTVRDVVSMLCRHQSMYNESLRLRVVDRDGIAAIRLVLDVGEAVKEAENAQSTDLAMAVLVGVLRTFLGNAWYPLEVNLSRAGAADPARHHKVFGPRVAFKQAFNEIVLYTADLDRRNDRFDPQLRDYSQVLVESSAHPRDLTTADRVRDLIELLLPTGRCSVDQIALALGVNRRTVHRHLASADTSFSSLVEAVRGDLATHLVASRRHSLTDVSVILGFSSPSNFSRWFRSQYGMSPKEWRNRDRAVDEG